MGLVNGFDRLFCFCSALGGVHDCELTDDYCKSYFLVGLLLREVRVITFVCS